MLQRDLDTGRLGVALNIAQPLLNDAEDRQFDRFGQPTGIEVQAQFHFDAGALRPVVGEGLQRGGQAETVNRRRAQVTTDAADVVDQLANVAAHVFEFKLHLRREQVMRLDLLKLVVRTEQILNDLIVQFAGEVFTLLLPFSQQAAMSRLERDVRLIERLDLLGKLRQQLLVERSLRFEVFFEQQHLPVQQLGFFASAIIQSRAPRKQASAAPDWCSRPSPRRSLRGWSHRCGTSRCAARCGARESGQ